MIAVDHWGVYPESKAGEVDEFLQVMLSETTAYLLQIELVIANYRRGNMTFQEMMDWVGYISQTRTANKDNEE
jgi:hypothetical protein